MFYTLIDGRIAFWTYRTSQKARNLARDPRLACLVEDGADYFELRGVQVTGTVRLVADQAGVLDIGRRIAGGLAAYPPTRWTSTWRTPPASGSATSSSPPASSPGTTANSWPPAEPPPANRISAVSCASPVGHNSPR